MPWPDPFTILLDDDTLTKLPHLGEFI